MDQLGRNCCGGLSRRTAPSQNAMSWHFARFDQALLPEGVEQVFDRDRAHGSECLGCARMLAQRGSRGIRSEIGGRTFVNVLETRTWWSGAASLTDHSSNDRSPFGESDLRLSESPEKSKGATDVLLERL